MPCSIMCASAVPPCPPTTPGPECGQRQPLSPRSPMTARSSAWPPDGESTSNRPTSHTQRSSETGSNSSRRPDDRLALVFQLGGVDCGFGAVVDLELPQESRDPVLDGVLAEHEHSRRLLIGLAVRDQLQEARLLR